MDQAIIDIQQLSVRYGGIRAVDEVSFQVLRGEVFGLLGPNGAGKTTTLSCIEGIRRPDSGRVLVTGKDVAREPASVKRLLGAQLQRATLFSELRARELVELYAALYDVFPSRDEIEVLLGRFGLAGKAQARPEQLSGGQQQRLAIALALVNDPLIVLLDEPTTGLDPQARRGVWHMIRGLRDEGRTVLLTTHYMEEAQAMCDRVAIIDDGRLIALDAPAALIADHAPRLPSEQAGQRLPNLEDVFLALTGRELTGMENGERRMEKARQI